MSDRLFYPRGDITDPGDMAQMPGIPGMHEPPARQATGGGIPSLLSLLDQAYARHIKKKLDERRAKGLPCKTLDEALAAAPYGDFLKFANDYLDEHRPVQQFPADANLGFMLSNNRRALLCPPVQSGYAGEGGQMQDAGYVGVTRGESQPGMEGVVRDDGSLKII